MIRPFGIRHFLEHFDHLNRTLTLTSPFQKSVQWQQSYITDFLQYVAEKGIKINCIPVNGQWKEFDTVQDFNIGLSN